MSTNIMERQNRPKAKGMQFIAQMTKQGEYFYLRIPKERNETARKYNEKKSYLLVSFTEVEVDG